MKIFRNIFLLAIIGLLVNCEAKDVDGELKPRESSGNDNNLFNKNILIVGSGNNENSGSISYISTKGILTKEVYSKKNIRKLNYPTSFTRDGILGYICTLDGIYTTYNYNFTHDISQTEETNVQTITDSADYEFLLQPKDIVVDGNTAYAISWGVGTESVQPKNTVLTIGQDQFPKVNTAQTITLEGEKPNQAVLQNGKLIIIHEELSQVSIVDISSGKNDLISVNSVPLDLISLPNGNAAVLCPGDTSDTSKNALNTIVSEIKGLSASIASILNLIKSLNA